MLCQLLCSLRGRCHTPITVHKCTLLGMLNKALHCRHYNSVSDLTSCILLLNRTAFVPCSWKRGELSTTGLTCGSGSAMALVKEILRHGTRKQCVFWLSALWCLKLSTFECAYFPFYSTCFSPNHHVEPLRIKIRIATRRTSNMTKI